MSPISNDKLLKLITELTSKVDKLSNIVTYQTQLIQELKTDNTNLNNLIHSEFNINKDIIQKLPIKQINNTLIKLDKEIEDNNNNIIIFTNLNKEDKTEYTNKDNVINFINSKLNTELVEESIIDIQVYNNKDNSSEELKSNKYIIKLDNQKSVINILKNKLKLKDTDYYINKKHSTNINNLFYNTRQLLKSKQITNTWVYNNNVYISTDKTNKIIITNITQLSYYNK